MELKIYIIMKYAIYGIVNPIDNQIVYIGQTKDLNLNHYLESKYWKLNEVKRGNRKWTKLFHFLDELPVKANIQLLTIADDTKPFKHPDGLEIVYIKKYRKINPNLLNEANGGIGGNTIKHKSNNDKKEIGIKISIKNKGRKKPEGFAEHLSNIRKGKNNPMAKPFINKVGAYLNGELIKTFNYSYEIDDFFEKKGAWSNIKKVLSGKLKYRPYGYDWKYIE